MNPHLPLPRNQPALVIVSGAPGAGKTTLASKIAEQLHLPLLCKDELKEALYDVLGSPDPDYSRRIGMAAYGVLYALLRRLLDAGVGAVAEGNFYRGWSEENLAPFVARARTVLVHCHAPPDVIVRRYVARAERGERHSGHHDVAVVPRLQQTLRDGSFEPLTLGVPTLLVDTTDGYTPGLPEILAFLRQHLARPSAQARGGDTGDYC